MRINPETLARASSRHPWRVVVTWVILIAAAGTTSAMLLGGVLNNDIEFTNEPESVKAQQVIDDRFAAETAGVGTEFVIVSSDTLTVQRYFEMTGNCAEAQRLLSLEGNPSRRGYTRALHD